MSFGEMIGIFGVGLTCAVVAIVFYAAFDECDTTPEAILFGTASAFFGATAIVLIWLTLAVQIHA